MSRFNQAATGSKTINRAGGEAYKMSDKEKLATILLTSFAQAQYYRTEDQLLKEVKQLVAADPLFAAKASIYARKEFGMRSITHIVAGEIFRGVSGEDWVKRYVSSVVYRADDITEIMSYYMANVARSKGAHKTLPAQIKKGLAYAIYRFDAYQLAKYRAAQKSWSLVDVVNMTRPKGNDQIGQLVRDELRNTNTWESKLSASKSDEQKKQAWASLMQEKKLGYFALLRNLNNIADQAPEVLDLALTQLTDERLIRKSLVLPFRYVTALENLDPTPHRVKITRALNKALEISVANVPKFDGRTLVVVDNSGSMQGYGGKSPIKQAALFGAAIVKSNDADLMMFSDDAEYANVNPDDSFGTIAKFIGSFGRPAGTNFHAPFQTANQKYDRMVILSDGQGWMGYNSPATAFNQYKQRVGANPFVYMWDLQGYGTLQMPENQVVLLSGFSEKIFDVMKLLETDRKALVNKIEAIEF